jgi:hypothetical protein
MPTNGVDGQHLGIWRDLARVLQLPQSAGCSAPPLDCVRWKWRIADACGLTGCRLHCIVRAPAVSQQQITSSCGGNNTVPYEGVTSIATQGQVAAIPRDVEQGLSWFPWGNPLRIGADAPDRRALVRRRELANPTQLQSCKPPAVKKPAVDPPGCLIQ